MLWPSPARFAFFSPEMSLTVLHHETPGDQTESERCGQKHTRTSRRLVFRALLALGQAQRDVEPPVDDKRYPRVSVHVTRIVNRADIVTLDLALAPAVPGDENRIGGST